MYREILGVDPGERHTGTAYFRWKPGVEHPQDWTDWECWYTKEETGFEFSKILAVTLAHPEGSPFPDAIALERYQLYANKAAEQIGSEFETVQLIGAIRFIVEAHNEATRFATRDDNDWHGGQIRRPVELTMQQAAIKNGTKAYLRKHRVPSRAKLDKTGGHCFDAELHGWRWLIDHYRAGDTNR